MRKLPILFQKTRTYRKLEEYRKACFNEVLHTTLNPEGTGVIRIHLVPPEPDPERFDPGVAIINGTDILPINYLWAILTAELIRNTNRYDGTPLSEEIIRGILDKTVAEVRKLMWFYPASLIRKDLETLYTTFFQIAFHESVTARIQHMNIGDYAGCMRAPHRIDLMVSAMTKDGQWHCNQKCVHCYAAGQPASGEKELTTEEWKKILDNCRRAGIPQVTFTGGEPTLREDLFELLRYARWFFTRLNTNGIRLTPEYCRALREAELDSVQITFYSIDREVHNRLVGVGQFDRTYAAIQNALAAGLCVSINTPLCQLNKEYTATLRALHELGVHYVTCSGVITTGNAAGEESISLQLGTEELKAILEEAVEYCRANEMEIAFTSPGLIEAEFFDRLNLSVPTCGACLSNMAVTPAGNAVPCQSWLSEASLGSMKDDAWEKIWSSPECENRRSYSARLTGKCPLRKDFNE